VFMLMIVIMRMGVLIVAVIMPAAFSVDMLVAVIMATAPSVIVVMLMRVRGLKVGAAFGVKRGLNRAHGAAKALHHILDDVIMPNAQLSPRDLHRQVPVAQMPRESQQVLGVFRLDFGEGFGCADNLHEAAVLEFDGVARAQRDRLDQIEQETGAAHTLHGDAAAVAVVEIEHDGISGLRLPVSGGDHFGGAQHGYFLER
jgi:hypothetical protein